MTDAADEERLGSGEGSPAYLAGLLLHGRRVVVVGGGAVAARRVPNLLAAGARVEVIAPELHSSLQRMADEGRVRLTVRPYRSGDLHGAWYVLALTDSPAVNAEVAADAEAQLTFCVRGDAARLGSAWTPTTGSAGGVTIAAVTQGDPHRARRVRDRLLQVVIDESL